MNEEQELNRKWDIRKIIEETLEKSHSKPAPETLQKLSEISKRMDENYSKRELDEHFKDVKSQIESIQLLGESINTKVGIQNGRVAKLEGKFNAYILAGSCAVVLISIIVSLVVYSFKLSQENLKQDVLLEIANQNAHEILNTNK